MTGDSSYAVVVDAVVELLTEDGPSTSDQLVAGLRARGVDLGEFPEETLEDALDETSVPVVVLADELWAWLPALLAGRVFTHRLTEFEVTHDLLFATADLGPVDSLLPEDEPGRLADGTQVSSVLLPFDLETVEDRGVPVGEVDDDSLLLLPAGYLRKRGFGPGEEVGLCVAADGLRLERVDVGAGTGPAIAELAGCLAELLTASEPIELNIAIWTVCADRSELFRSPLPPLEDMLEACGVVRHGDWVVREGFDFRGWRMDLRCSRLAGRYGLTEDESLTVLAAVTLYDKISQLFDAVREGEADPSLSEVLEDVAAGQPAVDGGEYLASVKDALSLLDEPVVISAVLAETAQVDPAGAAPLGLFAETLEPLLPRHTRPALRWLRAKAYELLGDVETAERTLLEAESLDPDWPPTLVDLARYAFDRGSAERGLSLLRRAEAPADHALLRLLERFQAAPRPDLGRNDACWCGSGRKYKKCHLNSERPPLAERADWLYEKASLFLMDPGRRQRHAELASVRTQYAQTAEEIWSAMTDPLAVDVALFEGGVFEEFLETRGVLLPDDERLLAQQWLLVDRSVYEVTEVRPGEGFTARDLRTGDVTRVQERLASQSLASGQLVCARITPVADVCQLFGGLEPVALHQRDALIELLDSDPDPFDLVEFLSLRLAPPALANTEGDPLVFCESTLRVDDPVALAKLLDDTYDRSETDEPEWIEHVTTDGMQRIRATLRLDGSILYVSTNSEARHERVLARLHELSSSLTLVDESRKPSRDTREAAALTADGAAPSLDQDSPEVVAALEQFVHDYEQRWLDEPIPALSGYTPRQAADDPTRRDDLIKLLDSFPAPDGPGAMSPDRLRAALDLPTS